MKEYGHAFRGRAHANRPRARLAGASATSPSSWRRSDRSRRLRCASPLTVAYHDACHLAHAQGIRRAPRALLASVPNLRVVEVPDGDTCCGSAGLYNVEHPDIAAALGARKAEAIRATGAQAVAAGNIGCLVQIATHLSRAGAALPTLHTIQILDRAYAAGRPKR